MDIHICYSSDNNYVKYLGVSIKSLIENASKNHNYYIYILDNNISDIGRDKLLKLQTDNCFIKFIATAELMEKYQINNLHLSGHITIATYLRLLIPNIFTNLEKIIYVDCDTIINNDIALLYQYNIENSLFGVIKDIGLIYKGAINKIDEKYFHNVLKLDNYSNYFNAGVLLYNLAKIRDNKSDVFDVVKKIKKPKFHDQCYLNAFAKGQVTYLPFEWNFFGNFKYENPKYALDFPKEYREEFENAAKSPSIIHGKLWEYPDSEYSDIFFHYARMTSFYESIIYENASKKRKKKVIKFCGIKIKYKCR